MKIAVDAMGGDHAPHSVIEGALLARPQCKADLVLIGDKERIEPILRQSGEADSMEVVHAPDSIGMEEAGSMAIRRKREASLSIAMRLLAESHVDAVVSAGNSAAIVATAKHFVGLLPGLRRPALGVPIPKPGGEVLLMDAGAHAESDSIHLVQSAVLANAFLKVGSGLEQPRIGLLNIGQENLKGTRIVQRAFALLKRIRIGFVGNVEPQDLFTDRTDAVICDGFVGNILLKFFEGLSETHLRLFEEFLSAQLPGMQGDPWHTFYDLQKKYHYQNIGGAPLLGVRNVVVVAHGRSQSPAMAKAIHLAFLLSENRIYERMAEELQKDGVLSELKHHYTLWMLDHWKSKWGFTPRST